MSAGRGLDDLIITALGGQHLFGFLPGNGNRRAISGSVRSKHEWGWTGVHGRVSPEGIGEWAGSSRKPSAASLYATWPEVLTVIELGCTDGHRQAYEAAYRAWFADVHKAWEDFRATHKGLPRVVDGGLTTVLHETTKALIRHGVSRLAGRETLIQETLFDLEPA
jgi:hypothetical protein